MRLPNMKYMENRQQKMAVQFLGVNYGEDGADGQFAETRNLSSRMFPCLSQRPGRQNQVGSYENATAVWCRDGLIVVDGTDLKHNGVKVGTVSPGKKQFANVNTKVVIMPDKVMYDTATGEMRGLEAEYTAGSGVNFRDNKTMLVQVGSYYAKVTGSGNWGGTEKNASLQESTLYKAFYNSVSVDAVTGKVTLAGEHNKYGGAAVEGDIFVRSDLGMDGVTSWGKITATYKKLKYTATNQQGIQYSVYTHGYDYDKYEVVRKSTGDFTGFESMNFRVGDTVEISGCTTIPENNKVVSIRGVADDPGTGDTLYGLVFDAETFKPGAEAGAVTIKRSVPSMTVICEQDNRLYGALDDTIYVSALGDPTNFNTFDGLGTDSYQVAVATEGEFTGCIGYGNGVLFFKEDCLHKLMGSYPSEYAVYDYSIPGVKAGSEGSLWNVNEVVYYHGREGVYRYSGGAPELISGNFGLRRFDEAAAGAQGDLYYISMRDRQTDQHGLWVYDIRRGIWLQEDETEAVCFARDGGDLYYIDGANSALVLVNPADSEETVAWSAVLCRMNEVYLNRKCYSKIMMRLELEDDAWVKIEVACDGGDWVEHRMFSRGPHKTVLVPIRPNRCDSFQIRLTGEGRVVIRSLVREFELGSEY